MSEIRNMETRRIPFLPFPSHCPLVRITPLTIYLHYSNQVFALFQSRADLCIQNSNNGTSCSDTHRRIAITKGPLQNGQQAPFLYPP